MKDGLTRKITGLLKGSRKTAAFARRHRASLTVLTGPASGMEHVLGSERVVVGRGPGADVAIADDSMSRQHALFELEADGWHVSDLGSTNGLCINGAVLGAAPLKHGDKIRLGTVELQYVLEERAAAAPRHRLGAS